MIAVTFYNLGLQSPLCMNYADIEFSVASCPCAHTHTHQHVRLLHCVYKKIPALRAVVPRGVFFSAGEASVVVSEVVKLPVVISLALAATDWCHVAVFQSLKSKRGIDVCCPAGPRHDTPKD